MGNAADPDVFDQLAEHVDDDSPAEANDDAADDQPAAPAPARRRGKAATLTVVLLIAALAYSGYAGWRLHQVDARAAAGEAALAAAKDYALILTTLDTADIDGNYARAIDGATGRFKEAYSLGAQQLRQVLIDNKASGKGIVIDAAVKSATRSRVEVLLFVDQSITNAVRSDPRIDRNRIQMTMDLVDGRWLAGEVDLV
ncbi:Mce protein [Mycolicibacter senuensis]|uniref:Mce protein n=1 Tax=Mycolicibacter senuensis TaxID=386913 RepID=A0A7I9XFI7_9MYCO|nr:Mce protein [Mycolicibacter senuensis]MDQ2628950.1 Mce protein [Actinomycetota bacterium]ORW70584.1 Mce protein [Mycolicibacter senuensis]GFG68704.1 hypothetical protein MSEN_04240 [Mycolicibacter senuensis]